MPPPPNPSLPAAYCIGGIGAVSGSFSVPKIATRRSTAGIPSADSTWTVGRSQVRTVISLARPRSTIATTA
jgi:hypothetical protein